MTPGAPCSDAMTDVMDVCDLSSRQHAALKTVIKVTSRGKVGDLEKVRRNDLGQGKRDTR